MLQRSGEKGQQKRFKKSFKNIWRIENKVRIFAVRCDEKKQQSSLKTLHKIRQVVQGDWTVFYETRKIENVLGKLKHRQCIYSYIGVKKKRILSVRKK